MMMVLVQVRVVPPVSHAPHTQVFGRVVAGMDTCTMIENAKADHTDKPFDDIKIVNIDIKH